MSSKTLSLSNLESMASESQKRIELINKLSELKKKEESLDPELSNMPLDELEEQILFTDTRIEAIQKLVDLKKIERKAEEELEAFMSTSNSVPEGTLVERKRALDADQVTSEAVSTEDEEEEEGYAGRKQKNVAAAKRKKTIHLSSDSEDEGEEEEVQVDEIRTESAPQARLSTRGLIGSRCALSKNSALPSTKSMYLRLMVYFNRNYYRVPRYAYYWPPAGQTITFQYGTPLEDLANIRTFSMSHHANGLWRKIMGEVADHPNSVVVLKTKDGKFHWHVCLLPCGVRYHGEPDNSQTNQTQRVAGELTTTDDIDILNRIPAHMVTYLLRIVENVELWKSSPIMKMLPALTTADDAPLRPKMEGWTVREKGSVNTILSRR